MKIDEIVFKHLNGELSPEESIRFREWLDSDSQNPKKVEDLKVIWERTENYPKYFNPNATKALEKVQRQVGVKPEYTLRIGIALKVAVAAALLIGLLGVWRYTYLNSSGSEITVVTGPEEVKDFYLPDSTHVWLNVNSQFKYPSRFSRRERAVGLRGEGYFEVKRNPQSPFVVNLQKSVVKVLGTKFNISSYAYENQATVTVTHGKVQYSVKEVSAQSVILTANEKAILNLSTLTITKESVSNNNFIAWKTHLLEFRNTPLLEVVKTLSHNFGIPYQVIDSSTAKLPVNALFNNKTPDEIIESLSLVTDGKVELHNDTIILK